MKKLLLLVVLFLGALTASAQSDCANAVALTANGITTAPAVTGTFQTGCYTDAFDNTGTGSINGIWYKYTPTTSGQITISSDLTQNVSPSSTDTRLQVFTGDCGNLTCYSSADDTGTNTLKLTTLSFTAAANTTYYFQWDNFYNSAGFDFDFTFTELSCLPVITVNSVTNTTATSITLNWGASSSAPSSYDVEYGPLGFTQGTGTTVSTSTNSITIAQLTASTLYGYYVRANCGPTQSAWTTVNTFTTAKILPYASGFDNETTQFIGWSTVGNGAYSISTPAQSGNAHSPSQYWVFNTTVGSVSNNWLFTPAISLQDNEQVTVSFWLRYATTRKLKFTVGSTPTPGGQTTEIWTNPSSTFSNYAQQTAPVFTAPTAGIYYFAFNDFSAAATTTAATLRLDTVNFATNLSTSDFLSSKFAVYPNPVNDIINFSNQDNAIVSTVTMTDLNGRVVKSVKVNATEGQISVSDLATGMYIMKISTDQGIATKKIIKE